MKSTTFTNGTLLATVAVVVAVAGAACSGGPDGSAETTQARASTSAGTPASREAAAELATAEFRVKGMTCGGCAIATEMAVKKLDGVESADAEYLGEGESGRCTVTYDPSLVSAEQIASAIEGAGYAPTLASTSSGS